MKDYRGIRWVAEHQKWQSTINHKGIKYHCGMHENQMDAVKARDKKIIQHGLNIPLQIIKPIKK